MGKLIIKRLTVAPCIVADGEMCIPPYVAKARKITTVAI